MTTKRKIKVKFLEALLASIIAVFAPLTMVIVTTGVLVFVDLMTGILAARKRGEKINSGGLRRTTSKSVVYLAGVCLGFLVEKYMIHDAFPISKIISGVIGLTELKSILENFDTINGGSFFKSIIKKLGSINDTIVAPENLIKKDDPTNEKDPKED